MLHKVLGVNVCKVIYHGLLDEFRANNPKKMDNKEIPKILWASRFIQMKEPMVLLEALKNLSRKINFKAILVGDGPLKRHIVEYIRKYGLVSKILLVGGVPFRKMPSLYDLATILVHTSSHESFGFCVLEGMSRGLPVIVPKNGGAYEIAGSAAVDFTPHDPEDLAEKIHLILSDSDLYYKQSEQSLQRSRLFTWKRAAKEYYELYKRYSR